MASLPKGMYHASMTARRDKIYILGDDTTDVYSCSVLTLLESCRDPTRTWTKLADLPVRRSTVVNFGGKLVCVGGEKDKETVSTIYYYNTPKGSWEKMGKIPSGCYIYSLTLATYLQGDKLIIIANSKDSD